MFTTSQWVVGFALRTCGVAALWLLLITALPRVPEEDVRFRVTTIICAILMTIAVAAFELYSWYLDQYRRAVQFAELQNEAARSKRIWVSALAVCGIAMAATIFLFFTI